MTELNSIVGLSRFGVSAISASDDHQALFKVSDISGFVTSLIQVGVASILLGLFGDWTILLITACGTALAVVTGSLSQWSKEKWSTRPNIEKTVIISKGNGSQHAIVVISNGEGLDLEALATGQTNINTLAAVSTRISVMFITALWIVLLICGGGVKKNSWYLVAVGAIGMVQNILAAGRARKPADFGIPLIFERVIGHCKVMEALFAVEEASPKLGESMRPTFFDGIIDDDEQGRWDDYSRKSKRR